MTAFDNNYFYELPEEIQAIIYKKVFNNTLNLISEQREALDNYDKLVEYIKKNHYDPYKSRAIWSIMLCYRKEIGDPYYKYFLYYADNETDFLRLNKTKMIKYNSAYSTIKYLEFSIYPMKDTLPTDNYNSVKIINEESEVMLKLIIVICIFE
jgi:hypothetical protein